jgi:hypothetical protein
MQNASLIVGAGVCFFQQLLILVISKTTTYLWQHYSSKVMVFQFLSMPGGCFVGQRANERTKFTTQRRYDHNTI